MQKCDILIIIPKHLAVVKQKRQRNVHNLTVFGWRQLHTEN